MEAVLSPTKKRNRAVILRAFVSVCAERDFDSIRNQDIIDKAEIAKSTFYQYFHHKEELRDAIADDLAQESEALLLDLKATPKKSPREQKIMLFVARHKAMFRTLYEIDQGSSVFWVTYCERFLSIHNKNGTFKEDIEASVFLMFIRHLFLNEGFCTPESLAELNLSALEREEVFLHLG